MNTHTLRWLFALVAMTGCAGNSGGGGSGGGGSGGGGSGGGGSGGGGSGGGAVYCGNPDSTECVCSTDPGDGGSEGVTCSAGTVSSPSLCCTAADWPNGSDPLCVCSQIFCSVSEFGDTCTCSFAVPDPSQGDKSVSTCTGFGSLCCNSPSLIAPLCSCFTDVSACLDGDEPVDSCDPSTLACNQQQVDTCN